MKSKIAFAASLALIASIVGPVSPSNAALVTKTFTVTKSDGTAYANADVALMGWSDIEGEFTTTPVRTNGSGIANVQVDADGEYYGYAVQPPAGDYTHAPFYMDGVVKGATESFTVQLKAANSKFVLQTFDGQPAASAWVSYPSTGMIGQQRSWVKVLRAGGFGLDLSTSLSTTARFTIEVSPDNLPGNFFNAIGFTHSKSGNESSYVFYTDKSYAQTISPITLSGESVIPLRFGAPNFSGVLRSSLGQSLTFNDNLSGAVAVYKANSLGQLDANESNVASWGEQLSANGSFQSRLMLTEAGKYFPLFRIAGSHTVPTFVGAPFYIDANGNYSMSESGPFVSAASFSYVTNAASTANALKIQSLHPTTNLPMEVDVQVDESSEFGNIWYGPGLARNGITSFNLRDGSYNMWINARAEALAPVQISLTVDAGQYILRTQAGEILSPNSSGVYLISPKVPNVSFRVVDPGDSSRVLNAGVSIINNATDRHVTTGWPVNGLIALDVPNGEYRATVEIYDGKFANRTYILTVNGQSVSVRDSETNVNISSSGGVFSLVPHTANVTLTLKDSAGNTVVPGNSVWAWANVERRIENSGNWDHVNHVQLANDGTMSFRASQTGEYRMTINISGRPDLAGITETFTVSNINSLLNLGNIALKASNFKFRILNPADSQAIRNSSLTLVKSTGQNFDGERQHTQTGNSGLGGLLVESAGTYKIIAERSWELPPNQVASKSYIMTVTGTVQSGFTIAVDGLSPDNTGVYNLSLATPNVTGVLVDKNNQPIDTNRGWVDISVQEYDAGTQQWRWVDYYSSLGSDSSFGFFIDTNGTYRVVFSPYGIEDASTTYSEQFVVNDSNRNGVAKAFGTLTFAAPTAKLAVLSTTGVRQTYANIDIQKEDQYGNFNWHDWAYTGRTGVANFSATGAGNYRFTVYPSWRDSSDAVSKSYSGVVTETSPGVFALEISGISADANGVINLPLGTPNIRARVLTSDGAAIDLSSGKWLDVNIQQYDSLEDRWNWTNNPVTVKNNGSIGGVVTEPGIYRLRISPYGFVNQSLTFSSTFTITQANAATFSRDFGNITLAPPTLTGEVLAPTGSTKVANAQVVPVDKATGQELWEYSQSTDSNGRWSLLLPRGSYSIFARAPWGSVAYGNSPLLDNVVVNASGVASINGTVTNSGVQIRLSEPTWSGTVVAPGTNNVLPFVSICLWHLEGNDSSSVCTQSNGEGRWALSKPTNFTGFNDSTTLTVHGDGTGNYAEKRVEGSAALTALLGAYEPGETYTNKTLSPAAPNVEITVKAGTANAANVWVNVSRPNEGWLGGGVTNQNGVAKIYIPNLSGALEIETYVSGVEGLRDNYTNTRKSLTAAQATAATTDGKLSTTVQLSTPNLRAVVYKPGATPSTPGAPAHRSWVEVYNETDYRWSGGFEANALGEVALNIEAPASGTYRYRITVNPPYQNPELNSKSTYYATITSSGELTLTTASETAVTAVGGKFPLLLAKPSVSGTVSDPDGLQRIRDSWVVPLDISTRYDLWQYGTNSNQLGEFGIALPDGSYFLVANAPWQSNAYAKSEQCRIDISGGALITQNSNCVADGKVNLKLRSPNIKFKLVKDGVAVPFAHVNFSVGNWYSHASSNRSGEVAIFIDPVEIAAMNPGMSGSQDIFVSVHPSGNQSGIVHWNCRSGDAKPLCNQLPDVVIGQSYLGGAITTLNDVEFMRPNTSLTVKDPTNTTTKANAWVEVFKQESGWLRWVASANSNSSGLAEMNLEDSLLTDATARFTVYVNPPWENRNSFARKIYRDLTYAQINNQTFLLNTPNLKLTIKQALNGKTSRWGWVSVQKKQVDEGNNVYWDWYGGFGVDEYGFTSLSLEQSSTFRVIANPGPGSTGTSVTCEVSTDASAVVSLVANSCSAGMLASTDLELTLSAGNLQGRVFMPGGSVGLEGAIVFAEALDPVNNTLVAGKTAEAVTNSTGAYGLQLSPEYNWSIKVFYVNPPGIATPLASRLTGLTVNGVDLAGEGTTLNVTLSAR